MFSVVDLFKLPVTNPHDRFYKVKTCHVENLVHIFYTQDKYKQSTLTVDIT